eukprot:scaffold11559_cov62-Alexandrium_tamarense.AAC.1
MASGSGSEFKNEFMTSLLSLSGFFAASTLHLTDLNAELRGVAKPEHSSVAKDRMSRNANGA